MRGSSPSGRHFACKSTDLLNSTALNPLTLRTFRTGNTQATSSTSQTDQVDISPAAQLAGQVSDIPDIRQDRVASLKAAIASGTYETEDKLNTAVDRLLDEIG